MPEVAKKEEMSLPTNIVQELLVLKGLCLNRMGEFKDSAEVWKKLIDADYALSTKKNGIPKDARVAPSPELSTP